MKIRCIANTGAYLPDSYLDSKRGYQKETEFPLTIGKEYTVYAFYVKQGEVWYYICEDNYMYYPIRLGEVKLADTFGAEVPVAR